MKTIDQWLDEYAVSHQNSTNKAIHWVCVPAIMFTVVGFLWSIPQGPLAVGGPYLNWATIVMAVTLLFYLRLSFTLFLGMAVMSVGMLALCHALVIANFAPLWLISMVVFVVAWVGQFIGHAIEKKKPSFFKDLQFLLIGPAWVLAYFYGRLGIPYSKANA